MPFERVVCQRFEFIQELGSPLRRERRSHADGVHVAVGVEQPEQERTHALAVLVDPIPANRTVGGALVLHLHQSSPARLVRPGERFGDDAVEAGAFESVEPVVSDGAVRGRRGHMHHVVPGDRIDEGGATTGQWLVEE